MSDFRVVTESTLELSRTVRVAWHREWSSEVAAAFAAMPYDPLMDPELIRRLWDDGVGKSHQKIAILTAHDGPTIGVMPLQKRERLGWQHLAHYVMPYSRFFVLPEYTDVAVHALRSEIDCSNVIFYRKPANTRMLRPETAWVVKLPPTYAELMERTRYAKRDRQRRKSAEGLELREDDFQALPEALDLWQEKWMAAGSPATARRKDKMLLGYRCLIEQGRFKTFSLHDGEKLASMQMNILVGQTLHGMTTITQESYRQQQAGIRCLLASMEWACGAGLAEYDMMPTGGETKGQWAEPATKSYRVLCAPFGSEPLGCALESAKQRIWDLRGRLARS